MLLVLKEMPCLMYYPDLRKLVPCSLKVFPDNAKFLENDFNKVRKGTIPEEDNVKVTHEYYDFIKISMFDGMVHGRSAFDTLTKSYGCSDPRISPYNVLKLKTYKFERIFVFYKESELTLKENVLEGERRLEKFLKGSAFLGKILSAYDENLYGQMAEIKTIKMPE